MLKSLTMIPITVVALSTAGLAQQHQADAEDAGARRPEMCMAGMDGMMMSGDMMKMMHDGSSNMSGMMGKDGGMMGKDGEMMGRGGATMSMGGGMMGMDRSMMMGVMRFQPAGLLRARESLELTAGQIEQLETVRAKRRDAHETTHGSMERSSQELREAYEAETPDPNQMRQLTRALFQRHADMAASMLHDAAAARGMLTKEQRDVVSEAMQCGKQEGDHEKVRQDDGSHSSHH